MIFTAYDRTTGKVLYRGEASDPAILETEMVGILSGERHDDDGWIEDGVFYPLPPRPSLFHEFDYQIREWVDSRTVESEWARIRGKRQFLLAASDWTQFNDTPLSESRKLAWAEYRQQLRNITLQPDPFKIVWPNKPE